MTLAIALALMPIYLYLIAQISRLVEKSMSDGAMKDFLFKEISSGP